jgi:hypothetical protein
VQFRNALSYAVHIFLLKVSEEVADRRSDLKGNDLSHFAVKFLLKEPHWLQLCTTDAQYVISLYSLLQVTEPFCITMPNYPR